MSRARLRRPALPLSREFRLPVRAARTSSRRRATAGLTHLAITDHDRIDVALEARELAPAGLTIIVGEEVKTLDGDLICVFLERAIPPGLSAVETIAAAREQGGLVGIPHPFDRMRGSLLRDASMASLAPLVDWVETHNARVVGHGNEDAQAFAVEHGLPGIAVSDAHSIMEVGVAYTALDGDPSTPAGLLAALAERRDRPGPGDLLRPPLDPVREGGQPGPRQRPRRPSRRAPPATDRHERAEGRTARDGQAHQDHGRGSSEAGSVGSGAMESTPALDATIRATTTRRPSSSRSRTNRPRSPRSRSDSDCGSRGRSCRSSSRSRSSRFFLYLNRERLAAVPELILQANPALVLLAFFVFYLGFPLRGYRWKRLLRETGLRDQPAQLGRDPVHLVVRQLRRAGEAR